MATPTAELSEYQIAQILIGRLEARQYYEASSLDTARRAAILHLSRSLEHLEFVRSADPAIHGRRRS